MPDHDHLRRQFLNAVPSFGSLLALAACSPAAKDKSAGALGPKRSVMWAVGTTGSDFVLDISVGAADATAMLGWNFTRVLNTQTTPDAHINAIRQAVTAAADVVITVAWYQAVLEEMEKDIPQGTHFAIVNSLTRPEDLARLNVPFVGQEPYSTGRTLGAELATRLRASGKTEGVVLVGNPFPGSLNVEQRIAGIKDGLATGGGAITMQAFADGAAQDAAASVAIYKAQIEQAGNVVAHAIAGGEMSGLPLITALTERGTKPGQVLVAGWSSSLKMLTLIQNGWLQFALDEGLYYQGFMAVMLAWSMLERGMPAVNMPSGLLMVTPANIDAMIASYQKRKQAAASYGLS